MRVHRLHSKRATGKRWDRDVFPYGIPRWKRAKGKISEERTPLASAPLRAGARVAAAEELHLVVSPACELKELLGGRARKAQVPVGKGDEPPPSQKLRVLPKTLLGGWSRQGGGCRSSKE